jgi:hypothetical protein
MKKIYGTRKYKAVFALNRLSKPPYKELVLIRDFTGR